MAKTASPKKKSSSKNKSASGNVKPASSAGKTGSDNMLLEFFTDELKDIYWAEKHIIKTLPKMQKAATSSELQQAFKDHLEVSKKQAVRLEKVFALLGKKPQAKKCDAIQGITKEGEGIIEDTEKGTATRDVGLILSAQKVEHYEISTYGGLCQLAKTLGKNNVAELLYETLQEEKETDELLTQIAENHINYEASTEKE
jgi:ferritin-like metal-binding protein YciE